MIRWYRAPLPLAALLAASLMLGQARQARAGGFLAARFGGELGHPTTDDATAIYYNTAGLSLASGTRVYVNGVFAYRTARYVRPSAAIDNPGTGTPVLAANAGEATLTDFFLSPFLALVTDLGIPNLGLGVAYYVPFGGQASWDKNDRFAGNDRFPGAVDGVQRWSTIDGILRGSYVTLAGAYRFPRINLSIGAAMNVVINEIHTLRARNADGTDDLVTPTGMLKEGRSIIDVRNATLAIGVGAIWQPLPNLWIGASYQSQPGFGTLTMPGTLRNKFGRAAEAEQEIDFQQQLPDVVRAGLRYRPISRLELRLFGDYQRWSVFRQQCLLDRSNPDRSCRIFSNGAVDTELGGSGILLVIPRNWKDGWGLRAGASWFFKPTLEVFVGAGYDANVVPDSTIDTLFDNEKVTVSVGGRMDIWRRRVMLSATYTQVIYIERTAPARPRDDAGNPITFEPPSRNPDGAGTYGQSIGLLSLQLEYRFRGP